VSVRLAPWAAGLASFLLLEGASAGPLDTVEKTPPGAGEAEAKEAPRPAPTPRPIRLVANEVIERGWARLRRQIPDTSHRVSVLGGLLGLGDYSPRGGADYGMSAPPRHLFPRAGAGNSLNVDPVTGRSYFTNTP
jgi:hypothetical protein